LAIGFDTRANLLYDLDAMRLSALWYGDFARQRSSGKSWFWESIPLKPLPLVSTPDIALRKLADPKAPVISALHGENSAYGKLLSYSRQPIPGSPKGEESRNAVQVVYTLRFRVPEGERIVRVTELFFSQRLDPRLQLFVPFSRRVKVEFVPRG